MLTRLTTHGSGVKTFVLLAGWNHSFTNELPFVELLAKNHTVLVVSLPGYAGTPESPHFADFPTLAKDIHLQLVAMNLLDATLIGFSMGCHLIAELARIMPINNLVLIGCPLNIAGVPWWTQVLFSNTSAINYLRKNKQFVSFAVLTALRSVSHDTSAQFSDRATTLTGAFDSLVGLLKSTASLQPFLSSALFIYGEHDQHLADAHQSGVKNLQVIAAAGHACIWGHEGELERLITAY